jgi:sulfur carrier protein
MEITLNGEPKQIPTGTTAARLIELLDLSGRRLAVEVNEEIVPRSTYYGYTFQPGDKVEIVHAIGGG